MQDGYPGPSKKDRQDVRVRDMLRLRVEVIDPQVKQEALDRIALERLTTGLDDPVYHSQRMEQEMQSRERLSNNALNNRLAAIEAKLDALVNYLTQRDMEETWGPVQPVNISAGGVMFPFDQSVEAGTLLKIALLMQTMPPHPIVCVSEVIRTRDPDPSWGSEKAFRIAARFVDIDPEDRDRIVRRVFEVQRMFLRLARERGETSPDMTRDNLDDFLVGDEDTP
ncbi:MAG: PilZ domain-containing protein [Candidatus Lernaella stagnicola]|nr:PilZ domain-containing protein [Candidatus Lernaella stagnicola]